MRQRISSGSFLGLATAISKFLVLMLCLTIPAFAALTGDIEGTVYDPNGAVVVGAAVNIRNVSTGATRTVTTNSRGQFSALQLDLGRYEVAVEKPGFQELTIIAEVRSGEKTRINPILQVGSPKQVVTVEGGVAPLLDVATSQISSSLSGNTVVQLPSLNRDAVAFAALSPGIVPVTKDNPYLGSGSFNANGSRGRANNITVDNVTATDITTTGSSGTGTFSLDAVQEVKLITSNFSAEFGRNSGSQLQIITKQGGNDFHGTAYWFHQDSALNARDYFDRTGSPTPFTGDRWGFTVGGPIIKKKLFAFGHYEGIKNRGAASTAVATVLTPTDAAKISDPTSKALFAAVGSPTDPSGHISSAAQSTADQDSWSFRLDSVMRGGQDTLSARYGQNPESTIAPSLVFLGTNLPNYGASVVGTDRTFTLAWTHILSPTVVNQSRFAFGRSNPTFSPNTTLASPYAPEIIIAGYDALGVSHIMPQGRVQNTFQYSESLSWSRGRHNFKFGSDVFHYQANSFLDANFRGVATFSSLSAFQNGIVQDWQQNFGTSRRHFLSTDIFLFGQDDMRVSQHLTLNLGLRMESSGGVSESTGLLSNLDLNRFDPLGGGGTGPLGTLDLGGEAFHRNNNWAPRLGFAYSPNQRIVFRGGLGLAYDYLFLNPVTNMRFSAPFVPSIDFRGPFTGANSYANLVAGTAQVQQDAIAAVGQFLASQKNFGGIFPVQQNLRNPRTTQWNFGIEYQLPSDTVLKVTYVGSKSDYLQASVPINLVNPSAIPPPAVSLTDEAARLPAFIAAFVGESGNATGTVVNNRLDPRFNSVLQVQSVGSSNYNSLQVEVLKRFSHGFSFDANYTWSHSIDDISDALAVLVNDSSAFQDPRNLQENRGNSEFDVRHRFSANFVWQLPQAQYHTGFFGSILKGWTISSIVSLRTGLPATVFAGPRLGITDNLLVGGSTVRANGNVSAFTPVPAGSAAALAIPSPCDRGIIVSPATPGNPTCANISGFPLTQPLLGNPGDSGRNQLRLAGLVNVDCAVVKDISLSERLNLQFRWEIFNLLNHPNFSGFVNNLASSSFGTYQSTATDMRKMQGSVKLIF